VGPLWRLMKLFLIIVEMFIVEMFNCCISFFAFSYHPSAVSIVLIADGLQQTAHSISRSLLFKSLMLLMDSNSVAGIFCSFPVHALKALEFCKMVKRR